MAADYSKVSSATFTPGAAAHGAQDVFDVAKEFVDIGIPGGLIEVKYASLEVDDATLVTTVWQLHMYSVTPPSAFADNAAWDLPAGDRPSYLGYLTIAQLVDLGSSLWVEGTQAKRLQLASGKASLFGYLVAVTGITSAAVAHKVILHSQGL